MRLRCLITWQCNKLYGSSFSNWREQKVANHHYPPETCTYLRTSSLISVTIEPAFALIPGIYTVAISLPKRPNIEILRDLIHTPENTYKVGLDPSRHIFFEIWLNAGRNPGRSHGNLSPSCRKTLHSTIWGKFLLLPRDTRNDLSNY